MIYDVTVIGAGIVGSMVAYSLAEYGLKLAVVEKENDAAMGTTKANSAIVHAGFDCENGTLKSKLNVLGCKMMKDICEKLGVPYINNGSYVAAFGEEDEKTLASLLERGKKNGVGGLEIISGDELRKKEKYLSERITAALYAPDAGILSPYGLAYAGIGNAVSNGADFYRNFETDGISENDGVICLTSGDRKIFTRFAVNCAGHGAARIAGLCADKAVNIIPRRGEYYLLDKKTPVRTGATVFACPSEKGKGILVSPTVDGNMLAGPDAERVGSPNDTETSSAGLELVSEGAKMLLPSIRLKDTITTFAGVRPTPENHDFNIYRSENIKGMIHLVGIESPGITASPAIGRYVTDMLGEDGLALEKRTDHIETVTKNGNIKLFRDMTDDEKNEAIRSDPTYGHIICRCETVTEGDIRALFRSPLPPADLDGIKHRCRLSMGRCGGGFCSPFAVKLISELLSVPAESVTKSGRGSYILTGKTEKGEKNDDRVLHD